MEPLPQGIPLPVDFANHKLLNTKIPNFQRIKYMQVSRWQSYSQKVGLRTKKTMKRQETRDIGDYANHSEAKLIAPGRETVRSVLVALLKL